VRHATQETEEHEVRRFRARAIAAEPGQLLSTIWNCVRAFEQQKPISKRRRGFPSEMRVKRGDRAIMTPIGDKEFLEKLGRNDPCPCGSGKRF
jgi:uncharacterized protein YecA (UPF0149 family)